MASKSAYFVGPRAPWEGTAQALTADGKLFGWRHTGMDQLVYAFSDIERAVQLGLRSILVADEGLLWLVDQARQRGLLPRDLVVKASALLGAANPLGIKLLVDHGLNTINVASDISLARLAALRQVVSIPIDLYIESPDGLGGFTRYHEILGDCARGGTHLSQIRVAQRAKHLPEWRTSRTGGGTDRP